MGNGGMRDCGRLGKKGVGEGLVWTMTMKVLTFAYRGDISRPHKNRDTDWKINRSAV